MGGRGILLVGSASEATRGPRSAPLTHPQPGTLCPQPPRTSSYNSNTSTGSRGCGWGQLAGPHHDWTSRGAGPPPLALCAVGKWGPSQPLCQSCRPTHCPLVAMLPRAAPFQPPRCPRASSFPQVPRGRGRGVGRCTCFSTSCVVGMGGCRSPGLRGAGSRTLPTAWGSEKKGRGFQRT